MKQPTKNRIERLQERFQFLSEDQARDILCFTYWIGTRDKEYLGDALQAYMDDATSKLLTEDEMNIKKIIYTFVKYQMDNGSYLTQD